MNRSLKKSRNFRSFFKRSNGNTYKSPDGLSCNSHGESVGFGKMTPEYLGHLDNTMSTDLQNTSLMTNEDKDIQIKELETFIKELEGKLDKARQCEIEGLHDLKEREGQFLNFMENSSQELNKITKKLDLREIEMAFMEEENDKMKLEISELKKIITKLNSQLEESVENCREYKSLYLYTRVNASKVLGQYLEELNRTLHEQETFLKELQTSSKFKVSGLEDALKLVRIKAEKNCWAEQAEYLSTQTAAQEVKIEELSNQLSEMLELLQAFQATGATPVFKDDSRKLLNIYSDRIENLRPLTTPQKIVKRELPASEPALSSRSHQSDTVTEKTLQHASLQKLNKDLERESPVRFYDTYCESESGKENYLHLMVPLDQLNKQLLHSDGSSTVNSTALKGSQGYDCILDENQKLLNSEEESNIMRKQNVFKVPLRPVKSNIYKVEN